MFTVLIVAIMVVFLMMIMVATVDVNSFFDWLKDVWKNLWKKNITAPEQEEFQHVKQAKLWHALLKELGKDADLDDLVSLALKHNVSGDEIPYRAIFTKEEFHVVLKQTLKERYEKLESDGYEGDFSLGNLPVAQHVKRLAAYILDLQTSLSMLEEKEQGFGLSEKAIAKKTQIKQDILASEEEIGKYAYLKFLKKQNGIISQQLSFHKFVAMEEEELLEMVDSKIGGGKPVFKSKVDKVNTPTSPALIELNDFLSENKLPDNVYGELQETIADIQKKLRDQKKKEVDEKVLTEAKVLNQTARQYHEMD